MEPIKKTSREIIRKTAPPHSVKVLYINLSTHFFRKCRLTHQHLKERCVEFERIIEACIAIRSFKIC